MEISQLKVFLAVSELGSVSKAALHLNCVQSNVTTRIKNLEKEVGRALFYRKPRGMIISPAGRQLEIYARKLINLEKEARISLIEDNAVQGSLIVGTFESVAAMKFPVILSRYHERYPEVDLSFITASSTELCRQVANYQIDGAFVSDGYRLPSLDWWPAFFEKLVLVCPAGKNPEETAEKKGILVFPKPCAYRKRLEVWLDRNDLPLKQTMELGTVDGMVKCIAAGMGMGLIPLATVESALPLNTVSVYPLEENLESVPIMFIKRKDTLVTKAMEAFHGILKERHMKGHFNSAFNTLQERDGIHLDFKEKSAL